MTKAFDSVWLDGLIFRMAKMKFNKDLIWILIDSLYEKKFITTSGADSSTKQFMLENGLQQGSINAPILFNLYTKNLVANEKINSEKIQTIAYADDIVIYSSVNKIEVIQKNIQRAVTFIQNYLKQWKIEINPSKCETILFRRPYQLANSDTKRKWKNFTIKLGDLIIQQSKTVKYLGVNLNKFCYFNDHINIQLQKAKQAINIHKRIFYSKHLNSNVKRLCYLTLIRPIITYGCPVWFNCSASYMEKIRKFERLCIRRCRNKWRKAETGYEHYISNLEQYKHFKAPRIDIHIINLIRNHIKRTTSNMTNLLTYGPYYTDENIMRKCIQINQIPGPETFVLLDKIGYIQEYNQIPSIYHIKRLPNEKWFNEDKFENPCEFSRYSTALNPINSTQFEKQRASCWWLQQP